MMNAAQYTPGGVENLYVSQVPIPEPGEMEVRIQVYATAINRADTLQRMGHYDPPEGASTILGLEVAGVIDKLGPGCSTNLSKGLRVMALLTGGGNAEYVICRHEFLIPIPENLDFIKAAAIPEVWLTAFQLLYLIGKLNKDDIVLIHAGGSGVGTAAIQLVKGAGAVAIATAGNDKKIEYATFLGADAAINYKTEKIAEKVLHHTNNKGVTLILDCVGSSMFEDNLKSIRLDGRWVVYGFLGGSQVDTDLRKLLAKRITMTFTTLRSRSVNYKENLIQEFIQKAIPLFQNGTFKPVIEQVFPLSDIAKAHSMMESNQNLGKIILEVKKE
ncbi:quinone oxidoreductase PIG3 [Biomphalaria pfeifferi]|uniref:Quinone oxidoreductase PIG3 n=1 Tax=Biomphalaria pfeifferi TaxID=112525 RepID=A0AAD8BL56_BIOPF|nr:quinone oxidoreductase PIG3 [Biomphalaria pfeifferi]